MAPTTRLCLLLLPLRPAASSSSGAAATTRTATTTTTRATAAAAAAAAAASGGGGGAPLGLARRRAIHSHPAQPAKVVPVYGTGPPPEPPRPADEYAAEAAEARWARRRKQAELLRQALGLGGGGGENGAGGKQQSGGGGAKKSSGLKKRFWKDVHVREVNGALEVHLDARALRHPTTKAVIRLPLSKPHLAHALALEWDNLVSAQQATKQHLIPLTSLACRALDLAADDADADASPTIRPSIIQNLLRYLDTDSLLCFSPPPEHPHDDGGDPSAPPLRDQQEAAYRAVTAYLTARLWPGVTIVPVLGDDGSILPRRQAPGTREVVQGWMQSLTAFELAALERATLAGKSLLAAARLIAEWSEDGAGAKVPRGAGEGAGEEERFGVEEAARVVSLEVDYQTRKWGEVEDTHDVEREDLRRQLGSAVLLVSGTGQGR
ncbi:hypothetical protein VTK26DRAFT_114 [Humicola hyalothermophila]